MATRSIASLLALSIVAAGGSAIAQTTAEPALSGAELDPFDTTPSATEALASSEFARGVALFRSGRPREAADAFDHSFRLRPRTSTLYNAAQAYRSAGAYLAAIDAFERYLRDQSIPPARRRATEATVEDLRDSLASVNIRPTPATALLTVDGAAVPRGAAVLVDPGAHVVAARASGFAPAALRFTVRPEEERTVSLQLERNSIASRWWLWTGVSATVSVAATAVLVAVLMSHEPQPNCGTLNVCVSQH